MIDSMGSNHGAEDIIVTPAQQVDFTIYLYEILLASTKIKVLGERSPKKGTLFWVTPVLLYT